MSWLVPGARPSGEERQFQRDARRAQTNALGQIRSLSGIAGQAGDSANRFRPRAMGALEDYMTLLQRRRTAADRGNYIASQTAPVNQAYRAGQSGLSAQLKARGLSADSSAGVGGLAALEGMRAGAYGQAGMQANQAFDEERMQNLGLLQQLLYGRQQDAEAQQQGLLSQIYGMNMGQAAFSQSGYEAERARRAQADAQRGAMLQQLAGLAGNFFGGGMLGGGGQGEGFTPGGAELNRLYAMRNNRAIANGAASARNARWGL